MKGRWHSEAVTEGLSFRAKRGIFAFEKAQTLLRCAGVTFFEESNQRRGGCDSPTPQRYTSVVCFSCYNLRKLQRIFASFVICVQPAYALELKLLSAPSAIVIRGFSPNLYIISATPSPQHHLLGKSKISFFFPAVQSPFFHTALLPLCSGFALPE